MTEHPIKYERNIPNPDPINPSYYSGKGMGAIEAIEALVPDKPYRWAAMKYLVRAGKKPGQDQAQDLRKAIWWIEREIGSLAKMRQAELMARVAEVADRAPGTCPDIDQEFTQADLDRLHDHLMPVEPAPQMGRDPSPAYPRPGWNIWKPDPARTTYPL